MQLLLKSAHWGQIKTWKGITFRDGGVQLYWFGRPPLMDAHFHVAQMSWRTCGHLIAPNLFCNSIRFIDKLLLSMTASVSTTASNHLAISERVSWVCKLSNCNRLRCSCVRGVGRVLSKVTLSQWLFQIMVNESPRFRILTALRGICCNNRRHFKCHFENVDTLQNVDSHFVAVEAMK
jgi:hypothetical protein